MDYVSNKFELSQFANKEINDICTDNDFAEKSERILSQLNWISDSYDSLEMDEYSQPYHYSFEYEKFDDTKSHKSQEIVLDHKQELERYISLDSSLDQECNCVEVEGLNVKLFTTIKKEESASHEKTNETIEGNLVQINDAEEDLSEQELEHKKSNAPRDIKPENFTSIKRKDVIFKSILRMMRRFFCTLLESNTDYNRKEKCINTKHKQLVKCIFEGVEKLGFNQVGANMPFYFAAFAYPNDMKKILKESKQQFRVQNDLLCSASFIVRQVDNAFNRFSKKIFDEVLAIPQISFLIQYYLDNADDLVRDPKIFET